MDLFSKLTFCFLLAGAAYGQDFHDWQSGSRLHAGDRVRIVLSTGPVNGEFQSWTPQNVTVGATTARREDVLKIERYRQGGSRTKHTAIGALIGFGGGFAIGASVTGSSSGLGYLVKRPEGGAAVGAAGGIIGAAIGALLPVHSKEIIYSAR